MIEQNPLKSYFIDTISVKYIKIVYSIQYTKIYVALIDLKIFLNLPKFKKYFFKFGFFFLSKKVPIF